MSITRIAKYIHLSQTIDLKSEKQRYLKLPDGKKRRSVLMRDKKTATFSALCANQLIRSALKF